MCILHYDNTMISIECWWLDLANIKIFWTTGLRSPTKLMWLWKKIKKHFVFWHYNCLRIHFLMRVKTWTYKLLEALVNYCIVVTDLMKHSLRFISFFLKTESPSFPPNLTNFLYNLVFVNCVVYHPISKLQCQ